LFEEVRAGRAPAAEPAAQVERVLRAAPFEDLGFARLDTHRQVRQGFPEVILGTGKTSAQVAAIAERIVASGHALMVTRATLEMVEAVRYKVPAAEYHDAARVITLRQGDVEPGTGTVLVVCAGTSDLPVAEEAVVTAAMMGN